MKVEYRGQIVVAKNEVYISSTSFQRFMKCPRIVYYKDIKGLEFLGPPAAALKFGSAYHYAMEAFWRGLDPTLAFNSEWDKWREVLPPESYNSQEVDWLTLRVRGHDAVIKTASLLSNVLHVGKPFVTRSGRIAVEVNDNVQIAPGIYVTRTYDAIVPVDGNPTVIDFKTSGRAYSEGKDELMSEQLTAYLLPHHLDGVPQPEEAGFVVATKTQAPDVYWYPTKRDSVRLNMYKQDVKAAAAMIRAGLFPRNRSKFHCGYCEYYDICYNTENWQLRYKRPTKGKSIKRRKKKAL